MLTEELCELEEWQVALNDKAQLIHKATEPAYPLN